MMKIISVKSSFCNNNNNKDMQISAKLVNLQEK